MADDKIRINRAPVLTFWAAVVAERLGFDRATALTHRQAEVGLSAYAKGVSPGIAALLPDLVREHGERLSEAEQLHAELLGRAVLVVRTPDGLRAVNKDNPGNPAQIEKYLAGKLGTRLDDARAALEELAAAQDPGELQRCDFRLHERFRPEVPTRESGWGANGELDLWKVGDAGA